MTPPTSRPALVDLEHLTASSIALCDDVLRSVAVGASSRRAAANRIVSWFYDAFRDRDTNEPAFVLARCFQTCSYARLPLHYRDAADHLLDLMPSQPDMRCLVLLATRGLKSLWNDPVTSVAHQAIPLPSVEVVRQAPMIARLMEQFGLGLEELVAPIPDLPAEVAEPRSFDIFHIPEAPGSPFIPAQDTFVQPFGVRSVLGMGGQLTGGELFAVILFARVPISAEVATLFRTFAPTVRNALLPFAPDQIFQEHQVWSDSGAEND